MAHLIADLNPGFAAFDPDAAANAAFGGYIAVNGRVIFLAYFPKGASGYGTEAGTRLVQDIMPGPAGGGFSPAAPERRHQRIAIVSG